MTRIRPTLTGRDRHLPHQEDQCGRLTSRAFGAQQNVAAIHVKIANRNMILARPQSERVPSKPSKDSGAPIGLRAPRPIPTASGHSAYILSPDCNRLNHVRLQAYVGFLGRHGIGDRVGHDAVIGRGNLISQPFLDSGVTGGQRAQPVADDLALGSVLTGRDLGFHHLGHFMGA
jgi:hypothetical protein